MNDWRSFFDEFAPRYDGEAFTGHTDAEVRFLIEHLRVPADAGILDVGCGTGRHAVGLALAGYRVTGVDLSDGMLELARRRASEASVQIEWVRANAASFSRDSAFDAAVCLCEGAVCLLGAGDDPFERDMTILANVFRSLRRGGRFVVNVLNGCRMIRAHDEADVEAGRFDPLTLTEATDVTGLVEQPLTGMRERGYTPPEIRRMLISAGFRVIGVHGGTAGDWGLRPPRLDEIELMAIAERPGS